MQNVRKKLAHRVTLPHPSCPPKLSLQNKHFYTRAITAGGLNTAKEVTKLLETNVNVQVSERTVCHTLQEAGLKALKKEKQPKLSAKNIKARLEFAKRHKD